MNRIERVREKMREYGVDGLLLTNFESGRVNIRYLSGFTGSSSAVFITENNQVFVTDSRYATQALKELQKSDVGWDVLIGADIAKLVESFGVKRLGLISDEETWGAVLNLSRELESCELIAMPNIIGEIRSVKDSDELAAIQKAVREAESALRYVFTLIRPGVSDRELASEFKIALMKRGLDISFPPIIISGAHSFLPHGNPFKLSYKEVQEGDIIQFDVGCIVDGYASDISRVAVCGTASDQQRKMHMALTRAISESKKLYKPGGKFWDIHNGAQEIIKDEGFPAFKHNLGHGLGMEVHEPCRENTLQAGNVITLEPGIYIAGYGGMRIERDVLITNKGSRYLDRFPTDLFEASTL